MPTNKPQPTIAIAEITDSNRWAQGCDDCRFGMIDAPPLNALSANPLYLQRAIQAANHDIRFCTCQAGVKMRAYLGRVWISELKGRQIEPDYPVPTIHFVQATANVPVTVGGAAYADAHA